jgi:hypothetical protein
LKLHTLSRFAPLAGLLFFVSVPTVRAADSNNLSHYIYPITPKTLSVPRVKFDVTDVPDLKPWAEEAKKLVEDWFPLVGKFLDTDDYKSPKDLTLVIKKDLNVPAYTAGSTITMSGKWIHEHPDDFGMVIHEMTHVLQHYPGSRNKPGWLVEGIADYIRFYRYEPEAPRPRINPEKSKYTDAYRTTAAFLAWLLQKYDKSLVRQVDGAMRTGKDPLPLFQSVTGKDLDTLWGEFVAGYK